MNVKTLSFENKILVFLNYKDYISHKEFEFFLNGNLIGKTKDNHFYFLNLKPSTTYRVEIKESNKTIKRLTVSTLAKRNVIYVDNIINNIDNSELLTKQLQSIFDNAEGSTIYFKKGIYKTGALFLKPNTHIYLEKDAVILGSEDPNEYLPKVPSRFEGNEMMCYASLINIGKHDAYNKKQEKHNIYIYGEGEIRGGGNKLCESIIEKEIQYVDSTNIDPKITNANNIAGRNRGRLIQASNIDGLVIDGIKLGYSPSWNVHPIYSKNIIISNCYFESKNIHNGDGIDPDSSENVFILGCKFNTGDDCVAIKSGKNPGGNLINRPSKNIYVFDSMSYIGHGCCIGSEISGGVKNVYFSNCDFKNTRFGVQIKTTKKRGGYVKNVFVNDLSLPSIKIRCVTYNDDGESSNKITTFKNFNFNNITLSGIDVGNLGNEKVPTSEVEIKGFEDHQKAFRDIKLRNIKYSSKEHKIEILNSHKIII